jgi:hypothetical protein
MSIGAFDHFPLALLCFEIAGSGEFLPILYNQILINLMNCATDGRKCRIGGVVPCAAPPG